MPGSSIETMSADKLLDSQQLLKYPQAEYSEALLILKERLGSKMTEHPSKTRYVPFINERSHLGSLLDQSLAT